MTEKEISDFLLKMDYTKIKNIFNRRQSKSLKWLKSALDYLIFYLFGIKISIKMNEERVNRLAWWIPIRKLRDGFRDKFFR